MHLKKNTMKNSKNNSEQEVRRLRIENDMLKKKVLHLSDSKRNKEIDFFKHILESIPSDLVVFDTNHKYKYLNPTAIFDKETRDWIIGKDDFDYCERRNKPISLAIERRKYFNKVKQSRKELIFEERMTSKDGTDVWILRRMYPITDEVGELIYVVGYATEITHLKKIEEDLHHAVSRAEVSMKIKEEFLANMSHEIRTPMNAILGMSALLKKAELKGKDLEYLNGINKGAKNLLVLINDILDFSKISSNKLELESIPVCLERELHHLNTLFQFKCLEKDVFLEFIVDPNIANIGIKTDPVRLNQILNNLLGNSIKFTQKGSVKLYVNISQETMHNVDVSFSLVDTGIGIAEKNLDLIFNPFSQADSSVTRKYGGTGLGLAITKRIVTKMGGVLKVESKEGDGSKFSFELTFPKCKFKLEKLEENEVELLLPEGFNVLLVEDNLINQMYAQAILENYTSNIVVANNGEEAIDFLKATNFNIILMDIQMPVMGGIECTKIIREELNLNIPIVALTANAFEKDKRAYLSAGMDAYLSKPFEEKELKKCLKYVLAKNNTYNEK